MTRWKPDAPGRLMQAAIELFGERGYEGTTVAEIASRAGLTERTFFRHFADKREVLFRGSERLSEALVGALDDAPAELGPLAAVSQALETAGGLFDPEFARRRAAVVAANPELQERELVKLGRLAEDLGRALHSRGVEEPAASLAAQTGIGAFHVAFGRWVADPDDRPWAEHVRGAMAELRELAAA